MKKGQLIVRPLREPTDLQPATGNWKPSKGEKIEQALVLGLPVGLAILYLVGLVIWVLTSH